MFEKHHVEVTDIRGAQEQFSIDTHGFMVVNQKTAVANFSDPQLVKEQYLPEVEALLRSALDGVDRCFVFNWRVRQSEASCRCRQN